MTQAASVARMTATATRWEGPLLAGSGQSAARTRRRKAAFHSRAEARFSSASGRTACVWPGPGLAGGHRKLTLAGRAIALKVSLLAPPRTHTGGHRSRTVTSGGVKIVAAVLERPVIDEILTHLRLQAQLPAPAARHYTNCRPSTAKGARASARSRWRRRSRCATRKAPRSPEAPARAQNYDGPREGRRCLE
jgi:hypothetical protein